jgi:hypothetical protein
MLTGATSSSNIQKKVFFMVVAALIFSCVSNVANSHASVKVKVQKIRAIQVDELGLTGCFQWIDEIRREESLNSPKPAVFEAKIASKGSCKEIHHFEIYSAIPATVTKKISALDKNSGKYCSNLFQEKKRYSVISKPEILPLLVTTKDGVKKYWCSITGPTYRDTANNLYMHFEAIYFPEFKINTRS